MSPATIAATPLHRMSFEGVIFMLLSRVAEVSRLVFICVSPFRVAVCLIALVCSLVAIVFFSLLILSDTDTLNALERGLELWSPILFPGCEKDEKCIKGSSPFSATCLNESL
jgi:hypothetical protein